MSIVQLLVILVVIGVVLWAVNALIPMDAKIKNIINVLVVVATIIWVLQATGLFHGRWTVR